MDKGNFRTVGAGARNFIYQAGALIFKPNTSAV